jgi:NAD(P)-dependent dehydrogenase (short-subunit alcohol dehydrogenase family)
MITDIDLEHAESVVGENTAVSMAPNFQAKLIKIDVTSEGSVKKAVDEMVRAFGCIDYCVNCAGVS